MKPRNADVQKKIQADTPIFQAARRSDVVMQIRSQMVERGLKNIDLAERLGVSEANVSRWLRGNQNLSLDTLYLLADALEEPLIVTIGLKRAQVASDMTDYCAKDEEEFVAAKAEIEAAASPGGDGTGESRSNVVYFREYASLRTRIQRPQNGGFMAARSEFGIADFDDRMVN